MSIEENKYNKATKQMDPGIFREEVWERGAEVDKMFELGKADIELGPPDKNGNPTFMRVTRIKDGKKEIVDFTDFEGIPSVAIETYIKSLKARGFIPND